MAKVRVHELAQVLGVSSKFLLEYMKMRGESVYSVSSTIEAPVAERVRAALENNPSTTPTSSKGRTKSLQVTPEHRRRVVAVLPRGEVAGTEWDHVTVVAPPARRPTGALDRRLYERGLLQAHSVLTQSPFDADKYEPVETARESFALEKLLVYDRVAGILGASSFSVEELLVHQGDREFSLRADGKHSLMEGKATVERQTADKFRRLLEVGSTNVPGEPNLPKAESLVAAHRLTHDPTMTHLLATVRDGIQRKNQTLRLNLTEEASRNLNLGAEVQSVLGVQGGVSSNSSEKAVRDLQILLRVDFDR